MAVPHTSLETLMAKLAEVGLNSDELVLKAIEQAKKSHGSTKRDDGFRNYLEQHIYPVTLSVIEYFQKVRLQLTPELVSGSLLHDALEDDPNLNEECFRQEFGEEVYRIVKPLTKPDYKTYPGKTKKERKFALNEEYIKGIESAVFESKLIKSADRLNNVQCTQAGTKKEKLKFYIEETEKYYLPLIRGISSHFYIQVMETVELLKSRIK